MLGFRKQLAPVVVSGESALLAWKTLYRTLTLSSLAVALFHAASQSLHFAGLWLLIALVWYFGCVRVGLHRAVLVGTLSPFKPHQDLLLTAGLSCVTGACLVHIGTDDIALLIFQVLAWIWASRDGLIYLFSGEDPEVFPKTLHQRLIALPLPLPHFAAKRLNKNVRSSIDAEPSVNSGESS